MHVWPHLSIYFQVHAFYGKQQHISYRALVKDIKLDHLIPIRMGNILVVDFEVVIFTSPLNIIWPELTAGFLGIKHSM